MNQIIYPEKIQNNFNENKKIFKKQYISIFIFSFISFIGFIIYYLFAYLKFSKQNELSKQIVSSYNIQQLYSSNTNASNVELPHIVSEDGNIADILGIINIDKLNLKYPIISETTDEFLKIAPCKFYGPEINTNGNFCIAGHNLDNGDFFSDLYLLELNDEINIYNLNR